MSNLLVTLMAISQNRPKFALLLVNGASIFGSAQFNEIVTFIPLGLKGISQIY